MTVSGRSFVATAVAVLAGAAGYSQNLTYTRLPDGGAAPSARADGAIAYDAAGRQIFQFGGLENGAVNDLWSYSLERSQWSRVGVAGAPPPARFGHTMILDATRRRLIVFGGQSSGFFSDTWAFDIARSTWLQLSGSGAGPSRRYGHSAVYDGVRDRMIISHGFTDAGRFDDTWAFDLASNAWRDISPTNRPLRRCLHHAVLDAAGNQMLLYGGCASGFGPCPLADLWSFDLNSHRWSERSSGARPPGRQWYGLTYDSVRGRLVVFGGSGGGLKNDTWEYDPVANVWGQPNLTGEPPSARERHEGAFADGLGSSFFFGGRLASGPTNELWMLAPVGAPVAVAGLSNAFSGQAAPVAPGEAVSLFGNGMGPETGTATSFVDGRLPVTAAGVSVTWNGIRAPLYYVQSSQINVQVPYELAPGTEAELVVTVGSASSTPQRVRVAAARPGLFPRAFNQDGTPNSTGNPAPPSSIVVLFATGQGATIPPSVTGAPPQDGFPEPAAELSLTIGGRGAEVLFKGQAPGAAGLLQINARVPTNLASGAAAVVLRIGEERSQDGVTVVVR